MNRFNLIALMFAALFMWSQVADADETRMAKRSGTSFVTVRGGCSVELANQHAGVLDEIDTICRHRIFEIFRQLGVEDSNSRANPIDVKIVTSPSQMASLAPRGIKIPSWSGAVAFPADNLILLPMLRGDGSPSDDLNTTLEHELAHLAFHRASNNAKVPRWFSEGLAIIQSEGSSFVRKKSIWWASLLDDIPPLSQLESYPTAKRAAEQNYAFAADYLTFLIDKEGWNGIRYLISNLNDGVPFNAAFHQSYGKSVQTMEFAWREQLFGGMEWLMNVTGDAMWLGAGAMICIVGFFVVRRKKKKRLLEMEEEEKQLDDVIETIDTIGDKEYGIQESSDLVDEFEQSQSQKKIESDGEYYTLH